MAFKPADPEQIHRSLAFWSAAADRHNENLQGITQ